MRRLKFLTSDHLEIWLISMELYGLNYIASQPWSDATCPRTTSDSAYFWMILYPDYFFGGFRSTPNLVVEASTENSILRSE